RALRAGAPGECARWRETAAPRMSPGLARVPRETRTRLPPAAPVQTGPCPRAGSPRYRGCKRCGDVPRSCAQSDAGEDMVNKGILTIRCRPRCRPKRAVNPLSWLKFPTRAAHLAKRLALPARCRHKGRRAPKQSGRTSSMHLLKFAATGLYAAVLFGASAAQAQTPIKIRNSWVAPVTNWASILLEKKELARHLGKSYVMEPVRFAGTPPMVTALANNELEIANLAYSTLGIAIQNAGLSDLRIIADEFRDGVEGYYSQEYMVLAD